jgi:hypothetical protein
MHYRTIVLKLSGLSFWFVVRLSLRPELRPRAHAKVQNLSVSKKDSRSAFGGGMTDKTKTLYPENSLMIFLIKLR